MNRQALELVQPRRPQGRPRRAELAALEARLLDVARQLFFRHGYGATTMSAVALVARVSKTTLYSRFTSKAALFQAIVAEQVQNWDTGLHHTPIDHVQTLQEFLQAYGDVVLRAGMSPEFVQINRLLYSESGRFPELAEISSARFRLGVDYLAGMIRGFAKRERTPCRDPTAAAELFLMMLFGRSSVAMLADRDVSAVERTAWLQNSVRIFIASRSTW